MQSGEHLIERLARGEPTSDAHCAFHPECECDDVCIAGHDRRQAQRIFLGLVALAAAIAIGVILASLKRFNWVFVVPMLASACFEGWLFSLVLP